ncbi:MAG TPA: histidine kinase [Ornithinicoccus sp.]|jgi:signal transduction histidine kinase|nr:histidine kinase [Ornithinicoccus sp.]
MRFLPPARLWGETWRVLAAAAMGGFLYLGTVYNVDTGEVTARIPGLLRVDPFIGVLAIILMLFRRRWPLPVTLTTATLAVFSSFGAGAAFISYISLCTRRRWREIAVATSFFVVTGLLWEWLYRSATTALMLTSWATQVLAVAAAMAIGAYIGMRREYVANLRERAETAEREQASRVAEARANERARIAREMHDVLAHRISLIAMHAGALAYREDLPREQVREIAGLLRDNADQAVHELRSVLGVLRGPGEPEQSRVPHPDLGQLDTLLEEVAAAGTQVDLVREVAGTPPDALSRTAYRIVQEALTNARKHAPAARVRLRITGDPDRGLEIEARNRTRATVPATSRGAGMGLVGLAERAELSGGRLQHRLEDDGTFVLRAWLPWRG